MKFNKLLFILAFGMTSFQLMADDDASASDQSESNDKELIARGGAYREQSLENRENRSVNRDGSSQRQQSLENRQENIENRQENR